MRRLVLDSDFRAFFERGEDIGDPRVLARIGAVVGLKQEYRRAALAEGRHTLSAGQFRSLSKQTARKMMF